MCICVRACIRMRNKHDPTFIHVITSLFARAFLFNVLTVYRNEWAETSRAYLEDRERGKESITVPLRIASNIRGVKMLVMHATLLAIWSWRSINRSRHLPSTRFYIEFAKGVEIKIANRSTHTRFPRRGWFLEIERSRAYAMKCPGQGGYTLMPRRSMESKILGKLHIRSSSLSRVKGRSIAVRSPSFH